jgi:hypothetical protein
MMSPQLLIEEQWLSEEEEGVGNIFCCWCKHRFVRGNGLKHIAAAGMHSDGEIEFESNFPD